MKKIFQAFLLTFLLGFLIQSSAFSQEVEKMTIDYKIGTANFWNFGTIFWQVDSKYNVRGGKVIIYNTSGKRTKYKCREQFEVTNESGSIIATSDFDYISKFVKAATDELYEQIKLNIPDGHQLNFINIEKIIINVAGDIINGNVDKSVKNININL